MLHCALCLTKLTPALILLLSLRVVLVLLVARGQRKEPNGQRLALLVIPSYNSLRSSIVPVSTNTNITTNGMEHLGINGRVPVARFISAAGKPSS